MSDTRGPGVAAIGVGAAHLILGARRYRADLRRLPHPLPDDALWFMVTGLSLLLTGADIAIVPRAVALPARRVRGLGVVGVAAAILSQRPRSGAWALLPVGIAMTVEPRRNSAGTDPTAQCLDPRQRR